MLRMFLVFVRATLQARRDFMFVFFTIAFSRRSSTLAKDLCLNERQREFLRTEKNATWCYDETRLWPQQSEEAGGVGFDWDPPAIVSMKARDRNLDYVMRRMNNWFDRNLRRSRNDNVVDLSMRRTRHIHMSSQEKVFRPLIYVYSFRFLNQQFCFSTTNSPLWY